MLDGVVAPYPSALRAWTVAHAITPPGFVDAFSGQRQSNSSYHS